MAEKIFSGRIVQKHDVASNWSKSRFVPKKGEIVIFDIDDDYDYERLKIGDGETNVNELPFVDDALRIFLLGEINTVDDKVDTISALVGNESVSGQINTAIENAMQFATEEEILDLMIEMDAISALSDENGDIYTDDADNILLV